MTSRARSQAGFTLLEMLIAVVIMAVLIATLLQSVFGIVSSQAHVRSLQHRDRAALVLLDRMEQELVGTILVASAQGQDRVNNPYVFVGDDRVFGAHDSDALRFITLTPARPPGDRSPGGLRMVTYAPEPRVDVGVDLIRREDALPEQLEKRVDSEGGEIVMERLSYLRLRYLSENDEDWLTRWDSTDIARLDDLPRQVEISVVLYQVTDAGEVEDGEEFTRVVELPIRPIVPETPEDEEEDDDQEEGEDLEEDLENEELDELEDSDV